MTAAELCEYAKNKQNPTESYTYIKHINLKNPKTQVNKKVAGWIWPASHNLLAPDIKDSP